MVLRQDADVDVPGQRAACEGEDARRVVTRLGHGIHLTLSDEISTSTTQACESRAALVVYSISRLSRSTKDMLSISERLREAGADLVSLSEKIDT